MARKTAAKDEAAEAVAADVAEDDELEELDEAVAEEELEELDEAEGSDAKPAKPRKTTKAKAAPEVKYGVTQLAAELSTETGKTIDGRGLRNLLRKLARSDNPVIARNVGETRDRYSWTGPEDPEVIAIKKVVREGGLERARKEDLDKLKSRKAAAPAESPEAEAAELDDEEVDELADA